MPADAPQFEPESGVENDGRSVVESRRKRNDQALFAAAEFKSC